MKKLNIAKKLVNLSIVLLVVYVSCTPHKGGQKNTTISPSTITATPISTQTKVPILETTPELMLLAPTFVPETPTFTSTPFSTDEELDICLTNEQEERVLFTASWGGDNEIYAVQSNGSAVEQLTNNQIHDVAPVASPDGQKIAYISFVALNTEKSLYVMNMGLPGTTPILIGQSLPFSYTWAPDNRKLAFDGGDDIWVVDLTDLSYTNLTQGTVLFFVNDLFWSPNDNKIAFAESMDSAGGIWHIRLIAVDSFATQWMPSVAYRDLEPIWHPQEDWILFVSKPSPGYTAEQIYLANSDGTGLKQLTNSETYKSGISWSPNGQLIAYLATGWVFEAETSPYIVNYAIRLLVGDKDITVFENAKFLSTPSWSPSNRYLAFLAEENGLKNLYVANMCRNETIRVVENVADYAPVWMR